MDRPSTPHNQVSEGAPLFSPLFRHDVRHWLSSPWRIGFGTDVGLFGEHQVRCDVLGSSAAFVKRCVDFGRRLQVGGQGTAAACGGRVEAGSEAALEEKVTSILGESQEADGQADGPLDETGTRLERAGRGFTARDVWAAADVGFTAGFIYGVGAAEGTREHGAVAPVGAATFPGSGRLQVLLHGTPTYKGAAALGVLCVRRLRERLGMRDLWAPDLDLVIGEWWIFSI